MEPARSDAYTSWLVGLTFIVLALGAATGFFVANPSLQSAYALPEARLVLETVVALAAAAVAVLAGTRFSVEGQRIDLLLCAGFAATAIGGIAFEIVPALDGHALGPIEAWAGLLARVTAAVLIAGAAFAPGRVVERRRSLVAAGAGARHGARHRLGRPAPLRRLAGGRRARCRRAAAGPGAACSRSWRFSR